MEKIKNIIIDIYTANWCPDCVRELPKVQAFIQNYEIDSSNINYFYYNNQEKYKEGKANSSLPVKCVPTIIFKKHDAEFLKIEENIHGELADLIFNAFNHAK